MVLHPGSVAFLRVLMNMPQVIGTASLRRVQAVGFPAFICESSDSGKVLAEIARIGWFRLLFGRGIRIRLPDGAEWRMSSLGVAGQLVPIVRCDAGKLAVGASVGSRSYGINGRDFAYNLYPETARGIRRHTWHLREHETHLATMTPQSITSDQPVPLAAVLLCFVLIKYGIPGEASFGIPDFRWA